MVELLIAIVIIALTATALLNSLTTSIQSSAEHRSLATIDTLLKSYAETAKFQIQLGAPPKFAACISGNPPSYSNVAPPSVSGYTVTVTSVQNWDPAAMNFDSNCTTTGIQQITVLARQTATGVNDSLSFVVIDPRYPQGS